MLPCGHTYDTACITEQIRLSKECPTCRRPCGLSELYNVRKMATPEEEAGGDKDGEGNNKDKDEDEDFGISEYGTKLKAVIKYLRKILKTKTDSGKDAKIILFSQFKRLSSLLSMTLDKCGFHHVAIRGATAHRLHNIEKWQNDPRLQILMLNVEDSV